jgi:hypothetical protein
MAQLSVPPFAQVALPSQPIPVDGSRGVLGFAVVEVPAERGYTVEASLMAGPGQCWPRMEGGAWWIFDTPADAEAWLDEEREAGVDWSLWAAGK